MMSLLQNTVLKQSKFKPNNYYTHNLCANLKKSKLSSKLITYYHNL